MQATPVHVAEAILVHVAEAILLHVAEAILIHGAEAEEDAHVSITAKSQQKTLRQQHRKECRQRLLVRHGCYAGTQPGSFSL